jgi:flagellar hook-basal body complex protein FliE
MNPVASIAFPSIPNPSALTDQALRTQPRIISPAELERLGPSTATRAPTNANAPTSFDQVLGNLVNEVDARQAAAGESVRGLLAGENVSLHQAMIATEEASISFQLMVEIRNKLLESYQEMMRMQI